MFVAQKIDRATSHGRAQDVAVVGNALRLEVESPARLLDAGERLEGHIFTDPLVLKIELEILARPGHESEGPGDAKVILCCGLCKNRSERLLTRSVDGRGDVGDGRLESRWTQRTRVIGTGEDHSPCQRPQRLENGSRVVTIKHADDEIPAV